ncbi:MAG: hypothetical protein QM784_37505 [Polyangiaceae bacterium]
MTSKERLARPLELDDGPALDRDPPLHERHHGQQLEQEDAEKRAHLHSEDDVTDVIVRSLVRGTEDPKQPRHY